MRFGRIIINFLVGKRERCIKLVVMIMVNITEKRWDKGENHYFFNRIFILLHTGFLYSYYYHVWRIYLDFIIIITFHSVHSRATIMCDVCMFAFSWIKKIYTKMKITCFSTVSEFYRINHLFSFFSNINRLGR